MDLKRGIDPRTIPGLRHRERGPKVYGYTKADIALASGLTEASVPTPGTLMETAQFIMRKAQAKFARPSEAELQVAFGERDWALWQSRWPVVEAWLCPALSVRGPCRATVLAPAFCEGHGGGRQALVLEDGGYMRVWTGDGYRPLHRIMAGEPAGMDVHHIDFNRFNNRAANLAVLTHGEHWAIHQSRGQPE